MHFHLFEFIPDSAANAMLSRYIKLARTQQSTPFFIAHNCMHLSTAHTRSWLIFRPPPSPLPCVVKRLVGGSVEDRINFVIGLGVRSEVSCGHAQRVSDTKH